jgi:small subunit ribosomal protein S19
MSRSKWKGPFVNLQSFSNSTHIKKQYYGTDKNVTKISRNSEILPAFLGLTFQIHNGKSYNEILVDEDMIGHKFGEFSFTRAKFVFKKKKKKKKRINE